MKLWCDDGWKSNKDWNRSREKARNSKNGNNRKYNKWREKKERKKIQTATRIYRTASVDETDEILQVKIYIHIVDGWLVCPFRFCKPQFSTGFIASHFDFDFDLFRLFSFNTFLSTFIHWIELWDRFILVLWWFWLLLPSCLTRCAVRDSNLKSDDDGIFSLSHFHLPFN